MVPPPGGDEQRLACFDHHVEDARVAPLGKALQVGLLRVRRRVHAAGAPVKEGLRRRQHAHPLPAGDLAEEDVALVVVEGRHGPSRTEPERGAALEVRAVEPLREAHVLPEGSETRSLDAVVVRDHVDVVRRANAGDPLHQLAHRHLAAERLGVQIVERILLAIGGHGDDDVAVSLREVGW